MDAKAIATFASKVLELSNKDRALKQANKNLAYLQGAVSHHPTLENRAALAWVTNFIRLIIAEDIKLEEWMLKDWYPEYHMNGKIGVRIVTQNENVYSEIKAPFQLQFDDWI